MEKEAQEAEAQINNAVTREEALKSAITASELYMKAIKVASNDAERRRLRARCLEIVARGEEIKFVERWPIHTTSKESKDVPIKILIAPVSQRQLSIREQRILLESSRLHGFIFPEWSGSPKKETFELNAAAGGMYTDSIDMKLSATHEQSLAGWQRPSEALQREDVEGQHRVQPTMKASRKIDLVQDVTTDCSVVASLCAAIARGEAGFPRLLTNIIHPYSVRDLCPILSPTGKYVFKFQFNGCFRQVIIDDRLPASKTGRTLFVTDRQNPGLLWPALAEKAYLKVRGGYDFPGSNSGTDLWALTGWIPEQIFLQSDELRPQELWARVIKSYGFGDVMLTLGTGKLSEREEEGLGLAGEHDYAVLSIKEVEGRRMMLVKNPWCDGTVWKQSGHVSAEASAQWVSDLHDALPELENASMGTFWIPFEHVMRNFESMYLNWNPGLFKLRQDHHFKWTIPGSTPSSCFSHNPQFSVKCHKTETLWVLLSKHFTTEEYDLSKKIVHHQEGSGGLGFISLYTFAASGRKVHVSDDAVHRGVFVDSPQTLAALDVEADTAQTLVVAQQDLPLQSYAFTLSVFSQAPVEVFPAEDSYPHQMTVAGAWTTRSAGGNASSPSYASNPQFACTVTSASDMMLLLESDRHELAIHVKIVWAAGIRVSSVTARDILGESGDYRRGFTSVKLHNVPAGKYTIICTTFESGQTGKFTLSVLSMVSCIVQPILSENAGRLTHKLPLLRIPAGVDKLLAPIIVTRLTRMRVVAKHATLLSPSGTPRSRTPLRTSLEHCQGPNKTVLSISSEGNYTDSLTGARTADTDVTAEMVRWGGLWLVVERLPGSVEDETVDVEVLSDLAIEIAPWGLGTG